MGLFVNSIFWNDYQIKTGSVSGISNSGKYYELSSLKKRDISYKFLNEIILNYQDSDFKKSLKGSIGDQGPTF